MNTKLIQNDGENLHLMSLQLGPTGN